MSDPSFFGYGSLVNLTTHDYANPRRGQLSGCRRIWVGTGLRDAAFLSVERHQGSAIAGIIADVPNADWAALDQRETGYDRHDIAGSVSPTGAQTAIYQVSPCHQVDGNHPILRSYLDVVVQGFLVHYGVNGARDFFATTIGWERPVLDDRDAPLYPRHRQLTPPETAIVDAYLAAQMK